VGTFTSRLGAVTAIVVAALAAVMCPSLVWADFITFPDFGPDATQLDLNAIWAAGAAQVQAPWTVDNYTFSAPSGLFALENDDAHSYSTIALVALPDSITIDLNNPVQSIGFNVGIGGDNVSNEPVSVFDNNGNLLGSRTVSATNNMTFIGFVSDPGELIGKSHYSRQRDPKCLPLCFWN
jgi:hypothetical protein